MRIKIFDYEIHLSKKNKLLPSTNEHLVIGHNSLLMNFNIDVRINNPNVNKRLIVGENSLINGNFIFENENGIVCIGNRTFIGGGMFVCIDGISIGNDVLISWGCTFIDNDAHSLVAAERMQDVLDWKRSIEEGRPGKYKNWNNIAHAPITVNDKAWIGFNSIILKGVTIGEGAIVGAGSVVTKDVPDFTLVAGNPAKVIKELPR